MYPGINSLKDAQNSRKHLVKKNDTN